MRRTLIMAIDVNGARVDVPHDARVSLLDLLRESLHLFGTKKGCDQGACGACTVLAGRRAHPFLSRAGRAVRRAAASRRSKASPRTAACIRCRRRSSAHDGFQCGYCTPGQICSAVGMLAEAERGLPSAVTADLGARGYRARRR
jgi:xanthine dehydrogenase YagT iron-sulfur-binding subunit